MKTIYIEDLTIGQIIAGETFAIQEVKRAEDRNGNPYYDLILGDKTGRMKAKVWHKQIPHVNKDAMKVGRVVAVTAKIDEFKGNMQMDIQELNEVDEAKLEEYLESSAFDPEDMWEELMGRVEGISDGGIKKLLESMLADEEIARNLKYLPAGIYIHHGFRSGLLQHILEILSICDSLKKFYPEVDYDLIIAGAIIHDIGKMAEFKTDGAAISFALEGVMVGHIVLSYEILLNHMPEDMNERTKLKLKNIILSHHGTRDKGSPVLPVTIESIMLHAADDMVFKVGAYRRIIKENKNNDGDLSDYDQIFGHRVYVGD